MPRRLPFRQTDVERALRAAKATGAERVVIRPDGSIAIEVGTGAAPRKAVHLETQSECSDESLFGLPPPPARRNGGSWRKNVFTRSGNLKTSTAREWDHYTSLTDAERKKLDEDIDRRWRDNLQSCPMSKRERDSLRQLLPYGVGVPVDTNLIKGAGLQASERLQARGLIEFRYQKKFSDRIDSFVLTATGLKAAQTLPDEGL